jgi:hypothetical protein
MTLRRLAPVLALLAFPVLASPAAADCDPAGAPAEALSTAEVAFVGRAITVAGPSARFAVQEVWAGEVDDVVEVRGVLDQLAPNQFGEDDRQWIEGATYLVIPTVDGSVLRDHICTATTEWADELEALRPADARVLTVEEAEWAVPWTAILVAVASAAVIGLSALAFRRR